MWPANTRVCVHCILFGMVWTLKAGNNERVSMRIAHETVATHSARLVTDSPGLGAVTANIQDTPFWKSATLKSRTLGQFSSLSLVWKRLACTTVKGDQAKDLTPLKRLLCLMRMPLRWMERFTFETSSPLFGETKQVRFSEVAHVTVPTHPLRMIWVDAPNWSCHDHIWCLVPALGVLRENGKLQGILHCSRTWRGHDPYIGTWKPVPDLEIKTWPQSENTRMHGSGCAQHLACERQVGPHLSRLWTCRYLPKCAKSIKQIQKTLYKMLHLLDWLRL